MPVHNDVHLHDRNHWLLLRVWCISGSRALSFFLVKLRALMIEASTIVPRDSFMPFSYRYTLTWRNSSSPRLCRSPRCRHLQMVVSSGTNPCSNSLPTNCSIVRESHSASSGAGSDNLIKCTRKCMRSIHSIPFGRRPPPLRLLVEGVVHVFRRA